MCIIIKILYQSSNTLVGEYPAEVPEEFEYMDSNCVVSEV